MMKSEEEIRIRLREARNAIAAITDGKADTSSSPHLAEFLATVTDAERRELVRTLMGAEQLLEWVLGEETPPLRMTVTRPAPPPFDPM